MVKETNNSPEDINYSMPQTVLDELAFVGTQWTQQVTQSPEVIAAHNHLAKVLGPLDNTITDADCANIADAVRMSCMAAGVPMTEIDKIVEHIRSNAGAPKTQLEDVRKDAKKAADEAIATAHGDKVVQNSMYSEQELNAQLSKVAKLSEKISHDLYGSMTDAEREQDQKFAEQEKELTRQLAAAKTEGERDAIRKQLLALETQRTVHYDQTIERLENGTEAEQEVARQVKPTIEERREAVAKADDAHKFVNQEPTKATNSPDADATLSSTSPKSASANVTFSGFGDDEVTPPPAAAVAMEAKAAVAPSLAVSFSGFDVPDSGAAPIVPNAKANDTPARQV